MTKRIQRIESVLRLAFHPERLQIEDESARHAGHAGAAAGGETHYNVFMISDSFRNMARIGRARAVHAALADEFASGLHALSLTLRTPEEQGSQK